MFLFFRSLTMDNSLRVFKRFLLPLRILAQLVLVPLHQDTTWTVPRLTFLPKSVAEELFFYIDCGRKCDTNLANCSATDLFSKLLLSAVHNCNKVNMGSILGRIIKEFDEDLNLYLLTINIRFITDFHEDTLKYLIDKNPNFIVLNNIFLLATYEGNFVIFNYCLFKGADDMATAEKFASFNMDGVMLGHIAFIRRHAVIQPGRQYAGAREVALYHNSMVTAPLDMSERRLAHSTITTLVQTCTTSFLPGDLVPQTLDIPMCFWRPFTVFRHVCMLESYQLYAISWNSVHAPPQRIPPRDFAEVAHWYIFYCRC